ncbi:hypothetical protein HFP51_12145 [Parasphingopyxis sp. CP4]|uniref:hypothetical protein n=1 Tax=Parasphingopyxis sp. CP4 TaxID=2724527 RepID=UPI00159FD7A5|nr:hypothetical protein [Parasphingopyxis sp. CP4]QLC22866.1 hypothetical protein HFP51_12145 [Parasphingopyxis sp. CP4]
MAERQLEYGSIAEIIGVLTSARFHTMKLFNLFCVGLGVLLVVDNYTDGVMDGIVIRAAYSGFAAMNMVAFYQNFTIQRAAHSYLESQQLDSETEELIRKLRPVSKITSRIALIAIFLGGYFLVNAYLNARTANAAVAASQIQPAS